MNTYNRNMNINKNFNKIISELKILFSIIIIIIMYGIKTFNKGTLINNYYFIKQNILYLHNL